MPYYVYIIANTTDNELYKGYSENPLERLKQHNQGDAQFTATKKNWKIVALFKFDTKKEALIFEKKIKRWNRTRLDKLIASSSNIACLFTQ
jgi:putative endonuclease